MNKIVAATVVATAVPTTSPLALSTSSADNFAAPSQHVLAAIDRFRVASARWNSLYDELDRSEALVRQKIGHRPTALIHWRNYHIGGSGINSRREALIHQGIDPVVVEQEYIDAKKRYQAVLRAGRAWDRKATLSAKRKAFEQNKIETHAAQRALSQLKPTRAADAAALLKLIEDEVTGNEFERWERAVFRNASRFFTQVLSERISPPTAPTEPTVDGKIFAAIDEHRAAALHFAKMLEWQDSDEARKLPVAERWGPAETFWDEVLKPATMRLISTSPETPRGLAALLAYIRESGGLHNLIGDGEPALTLARSIERAACNWAGLPQPAGTDRAGIADNREVA
ncbi:hypothetical protein HU675_0010730 [Bradyrhizobium septentrionale]|uniref:hypothetical protein n=1 Tax=Bradyrhizobium septentrionale TaxID=1404411 RepID=UPI001596EFC0|nr:hypothetical protein [Bradyrhizobium septentrionale]UGY27184.1 hypothetical protein HU675_0010730 [Bradyrhizobium septentrionale]